jgi:hypothetical protein
MVELNGNYTLRASPVGGVGGMFATSNGTFKIVTVAAQVPPTFDRQTVSFCVACHLDGHTNVAASLPLVEDYSHQTQEGHVHNRLVPQRRCHPGW